MSVGKDLKKVQVLQGLVCAKRMALDAMHPEWAAPASPEEGFRHLQSRQTEAAARAEFPGGRWIQSRDRATALRDTANAIALGEDVLFNAAFIHREVFVRVDILRRFSEGWQLIALKSSRRLKRQHVKDAAIQRWAVVGNGFEIISAVVMHLNPDYTRPSGVSLFVLEDVTQTTEDHGKTLDADVARLQEIMRSGQVPVTDIGPHCTTRPSCAFQAHCWGEKEVPSFSVLNLPQLHNKWELYKKGAITLSQAQAEELPQRARRVLSSTLSGRRWVDKAALEKALSELLYPLTFLDFEATAFAVPRFRELRPYEALPFQFSLIVQPSQGAAAAETFFLHEDVDDPRPALLEALLKALPPQGSILAYNRRFERDCLTKLAVFAPEHAPALKDAASRLVDPCEIVRHCVYDPAFRGSFSLKSVAPALLGPAFDYAGLEVSNGIAAQVAYDLLQDTTTSPAAKREIRRAVLEYCRRDTESLVALIGWMQDALREHAA